MLSILHTFCVVSCLISGIYSCIIYYRFRNAKRMIWFAFSCFALFANTCTTVSFYPGMLLNAKYINGISDNVFFASLAFVTLCLCIYTGCFETEKPLKHNFTLCYICSILAAVGAIVPASLSLCTYVILWLFFMYGLIRCLIISIRAVKKNDKAYIFPATAYGLFIAAAVTDSLIFHFFKEYHFSIRVLILPIFLTLHCCMMTYHYKASLDKTHRLSQSLLETIEKINHSDNALMCTQMKSDFLYKSLDLISKRCDEDPFAAEDLTVSLSKYLRHTLNFQQLQGIVPLSNEIELTKAFIAIEKQRNPRLKFVYNFPTPLPDFHIPPLSIQPIVENAIEHAFSDEIEDPTITITIMSYRDYYHIDISDNGIGMDEDTIEALTDSLHGNARVGIYSIHTRLINLFGKGIVVQSAPGVGTSVSFVVPPDAVSFIKDKENEGNKEVNA